MRLETIKLGDVYPDPNNPRKDFGDIEALAGTFAFNTENPGQPINPIVVVQDGEMFRIVDGERRYRAMLHYAGGDNESAASESIKAIVCEDLDEADAMVNMVTTDDKQRLTEGERSRGYQQMLLLGVAPEKVDQVGRFEKGTAMRVNHAMILVGERSEQLTLDHLLAIEEFKDDPEAVRELSESREDKWQIVLARLKHKRSSEKFTAAAIEFCEENGLAYLLDGPYVSMGKDGYQFDSSITAREAKDGTWTFSIKDTSYQDKGAIVLISQSPYDSNHLWIYKPVSAGAGEVDLEEEERRKEAEGIIDFIDRLLDDIFAWYYRCNAASNTGPFPFNTSNTVISIHDRMYRDSYDFESFEKRVERCKVGSIRLAPSSVEGAASVFMWQRLIKCPTRVLSNIRELLDGKVPRFLGRQPWADLEAILKAVADDGYQPQADIMRGMRICRDFLEVFDGKADAVEEETEEEDTDDDIYEVD